MPEWEDVDDDGLGSEPPPASPDRNNPFGGVSDVDAIVYERDDSDVELRGFDMPVVPPPPKRRAPVRAKKAPAVPWEALQIDPEAYRRRTPSNSSHRARTVLIGLVPILLIFGVMFAVLRAYNVG